jgi:hypothetical protein
MRLTMTHLWLRYSVSSANSTFRLMLSNGGSGMTSIVCLFVERFILYTRCFPHVVNLACKAVLAAITNMDFARLDLPNFVPDNTAAFSLYDAINKDPIATSRTLVCMVRIPVQDHISICFYLTDTCLFIAPAIFLGSHENPQAW